MSNTSDRHIEWTSLDEIKGEPKNAKGHDIGAIVESIRRFGFIETLVINEVTGKLVSGHGRVMALKALRKEGGEAPPGVNVVDGEWQIPVTRGVSFRSDGEALAFTLAANQTTILGGWDDGALADVLQEINGTPEGLAGTGFDVEDLDRLAASLSAGNGETGTGGEACPTCGRPMPKG